MKMGTLRLTAWGTLAVVILLAVATSPFWTVMFIRQQATRMVDDSLVGLTTSGLANLSIAESFLETSLVVSTTDPATRDRNLEQITAIMHRTDQQLDAYRVAIDDATDRQNYEQLLERRAQFRETRGKVFELLKQGKRDEALQLYNSKGLQEFHRYLEALDRLVQYNVDDAKAAGEKVTRWCNFLLIIQGVLVVFFFVYAFYVPLLAFLERVTTRQDVVEDI